MSELQTPVCRHGNTICFWLKTHYYCPKEGHPLEPHHQDGSACQQELVTTPITAKPDATSVAEAIWACIQHRWDGQYNVEEARRMIQEAIDAVKP